MLILVKHGAPRLEPGTPPSQWTLAPEGRDQAERIAGKLADCSPSAVVSSLEPKAVETAAVIAGAFGLVAELDAGLGEQRNDEGPFTDAVRFQAAGTQRLGVERCQTAERGARVKQASVEEIRAGAARLQGELAEAQDLAAQGEVEEVALVGLHGADAGFLAPGHARRPR